MTGCVAPEIEHAHLVSASSNRFEYECNGLYSLVGDAVLTCTTGVLRGSVSCNLPFLDDVWFWLLIAAGIILLVLVITFLCIFCVRKWKRRRRRIRPNSADDDIDDVGCFEYSGTCDVCCTDYYGCCSLLGCCGYRGCCACFCACSRCCREPEAGPGISNLPVSYFHSRKRKRTRFSDRNKVVIVHTEQVNKSGTRKKRKAKIPVVPVWLPHSNPIRNFNTSTR